ncbi:Abi family protein [Epilithonimonas hungarica]|uniref:Abortive infection bacteriophage resistance protein n=1 Tax=Epilithonimonas hungarica TaxID=454006 RepID=A0A1G7FSN9_9FLAO|nr:Abi family protein [Epilithonimonas hungarica]SDE78911.1 Abortive infection bacteriophage resistance protein [Epilithonimonas hungarica]
MGNIATTFNQQIALLESRGMVFDFEPNKVKEILLDIGYYRLGFYWHPFVIDENHNLIKGTKFSDAVNLYYLDVDLRNILTKYLNRIEINLRTNVVYYVSNKYRTNPFWFIDPKVINQIFINNIDRYYNDEFKLSNKPIKKHHQKYLNDKYAPAWKTLEFFSFGVILKIFKNLNDKEIKSRISNMYGVYNLSKFESLMDTLIFLRNTCAHCGVLFDLKLPKGISKIPDLDFNNNDRMSLDSSIKVVLYILGKISESRRQEMEQEINCLFEKYRNHQILRRIIEEKTNFVYK